MKICLEQPPVRNEYESLGGAAVGENVHYGRCWLEQKYQMLGSAETVITEGGIVVRDAPEAQDDVTGGEK